MHDVLPAYANAWYGVGKTPQEIGSGGRKAARRRGYRGLKFDPFEDAGRDPDKASIRKAVEIVEAVRAGTGPNVDLMIDAHGRFSPGSAIAIARELEPCDLFWFEEPCDPDNVPRSAMVGRNIKTRLANGERCTSRAAMAGAWKPTRSTCCSPHRPCRRTWWARRSPRWRTPIISRSRSTIRSARSRPGGGELDACTTNFFMQ